MHFVVTVLAKTDKLSCLAIHDRVGKIWSVLEMLDMVHCVGSGIDSLGFAHLALMMIELKDFLSLLLP